tara:strand:- start:3447 stop:4970 length:1524 start_codon:yes stop_codon:yes gene_type:complete
MKIVVYGLCLANHIKSHWKDRENGIKNIKSKYKIDSKLFVDQDASLTPEMRSLVGNDTEIIDIRKFPTPKLQQLPRFKQNLNIGYKGMCLFYSSEFVHYLSEYDYAIRLDGDSVVASELYIDEFIESNKIYGYVRDKQDSHRETCETLPVAIKSYVNDNNIKINCKESDINCWNFYNNFNISRLSFWNTQNFKNFMQFIHDQDGIEKHRWGDSTIQANAVKMFCKPNEIFKFDFAYEHRSHYYKNYEEIPKNVKSNIQVTETFKKVKSTNTNKLNAQTKTGLPASYHHLLNRYKLTDNVDFIIEGGSRDCADAIKLSWSLNKKVYAFECNPSCLDICKYNLSINNITSNQVEIIPNALYHENTKIDFYCTVDTRSPFGPNDPNLIDSNGKRPNIGTSSILQFNERWSKVHTSEKVKVDTIKLDTFIEKHNLTNQKYILCMDLQGAEYYAILGNEKYIKNCKAIILEFGSHQYVAPNECSFKSLNDLLSKYDFVHLNKGDRGDAIYTR